MAHARPDQANLTPAPGIKRQPRAKMQQLNVPETFPSQHERDTNAAVMSSQSNCVQASGHALATNEAVKINVAGPTGMLNVARSTGATSNVKMLTLGYVNASCNNATTARLPKNLLMSNVDVFYAQAI